MSVNYICLGSLDLTSDNKYIVSGNTDKTIRIDNLQTGIQIKTLTGHTDFVRSIAISSEN